MGAALLIGLGLLSGCTETVDSTNIKTGGIAAIIEAKAESDKATTIIATLKVGGPSSNTYVDLSSSDGIFASQGEKKVEMQSQSSGVYEAEFATAAENTEFVVSLERKNDTPAPNSRGSLPGPLALTLPATEASRAADFEITWDPSGSTDDVTIELDGTCIFHSFIEVAGDPGKHTIAANSLKPTNTMMPENCDITVEITRSRKGETDAAYDSESSFVLKQVRTAKFTSTP